MCEVGENLGMPYSSGVAYGSAQETRSTIGLCASVARLAQNHRAKDFGGHDTQQCMQWFLQLKLS